MRQRLMPVLLAIQGLLFPASLWGERIDKDPFRQLDEWLPDPSSIRTASGAPGPDYWQQKVDYEIDVRLDEDHRTLIGREKITYLNQSPDRLRYLWLQIDPNLYAKGSEGALIQNAPDPDQLTYKGLRSELMRREFDGACRIESVTDSNQKPLHHIVVGTMMRVDLPEALGPGESVVFHVEWSYGLVDAGTIRIRGGYEFFEEDGNCIFEVAQWFPRLAAYYDVMGWQHKQFLGSGEFTLEFGDYLVRITAPADHIVAATGLLQNPEDVLSSEQRQRLKSARSSDKPEFIVTPNEAESNERSRSTETKTWVFSAKNVRDFAWASSRKFIWDAMGHEVGGNPVLAMSYYPKEGEPLWSRYSTHSIVHTLNVYSRFTFDYPYPVALSVNGPVGGMEYPMICFNGPRPEKDGTYSARTKYGLISVIIHEVGHNYFPMIVNSDERQWTWMDEGLNTFLQYLSEQEWEEDYPSRRGEPKDIIGFMTSRNQMPIMTNSESILQFGNNAYAKPATALNILRETILGRALFDFAFKEYSRRWQFKRPAPADLFRTLEDASGIDLDWFWRGWFYSTQHVDLGITGLTRLKLKTRDPVIDKAELKKERDNEPTTLSQSRNAGLPKYIDRFPELRDFYNDYDPLDVTDKDRDEYRKLLEELADIDEDLLKTRLHLAIVRIENAGGLVMPVILRIRYLDGSEETIRYPAEIWTRNPDTINKLLITEKEITAIELDPHLETADTNRNNNHWPAKADEKWFQLKEEPKDPNPMREALETDRDAETPEGKSDPNKGGA